MYLGTNADGLAVRLPPNDLLTHGVVLGQTGSGKTGLTHALIEEATSHSASAIVFDPKGDLTNLALPLTTREEFAYWSEPGVDADELYLRSGEGLTSFALGYDHVAWWRDAVDVTIYAPGKTFGGGRSINVFPTFAPPRQSDTVPPRVRASREVQTVLQAIDGSEDPYDPALVFMTEAVILAWGRNMALPVSSWPGLLAEPPSQLNSFGGMALDDFFPKRQRKQLARALIGFRHQADRWLAGDKLDLHQIVNAPKPQIAVFTMRHLSEEDRLFFTALMMNRLVDFMFETGASQTLKLLVVLDEARGYLPPYPKNPPTKQPICTLLAQARAQGIGLLIGTQNPMDLDYKALSNVGTWFVGKLRERDCARDLAAELRSRGVDIGRVSNIAQRRFLTLDKRGGHTLLDVRWCYNYLRGPLSPQHLGQLDHAAVAHRIKINGVREPGLVSRITRFFR